MFKSTTKFCLKAAAVAAVLATGATVEAAGPIASAKAMGMGGAAVAYPQDSITPYYNPATGTCTDTRFDVGVTARYSGKELRLSDRPAAPVANLPTGKFKANRDFDAYGDFGINWRLGCCCDWALGLQYNNYDHTRTRYRQPLADFSGGTGLAPMGNKLKFDYRVEVLTLSSAYQVNDCHSFGIGLNFYSSWLTVEGLEAIANVNNGLSADPANVTNRGTDDAKGVGVTIGWFGQLTNCLWGGASWTSKASMGDFKRYRGLLADHGFDIPEVWRLGLSYKYDPCTIIAADFEYRRYSQINSWSNDFPGNSTGVFSPLFGTSNGPGFGWQDQWNFKIGAERCINECWTGRIGYRHEQYPIRDKGGTDIALNALTLHAVQDYLSFGVTWKPDDCNEFNYFSETGFRNTKKGQYPNISGVPDWSPANVSFQNYTYTWGLSYGRTF